MTSSIRIFSEILKILKVACTIITCILRYVVDGTGRGDDFKNCPVSTCFACRLATKFPIPQAAHALELVKVQRKEFARSILIPGL